jgi:hypothetical protein
MVVGKERTGVEREKAERLGLLNKHNIREQRRRRKW